MRHSFGALPQRIQQCGKVRGQRRLQAEFLAGSGVLESEFRRMQRLATKPAQGRDEPLARTRRQGEPAAVNRVADESVATVGEMHANLVGPARFEPDPYIGMRREALQHRVVRDCRLAVVPDAHPLAVYPVPADRRIDGPAAGQYADADRQVIARYLAAGERPYELGMRGQRLGNQQQPARVLSSR